MVRYLRVGDFTKENVKNKTLNVKDLKAVGIEDGDIKKGINIEKELDENRIHRPEKQMKKEEVIDYLISGVSKEDLEALKEAEKSSMILSEKPTDEKEDMKSKLGDMFGKDSADKLVYDTDEYGNIILGIDENGKPIIQKKAIDIENLALQIEVPLDFTRAVTEDEEGFTPAERRRYEKLKALNRGEVRSDAELRMRAKSEINTLDNTIPDMMVHFMSAPEDKYNDLNDYEKSTIKDLRRKGFYMSPETLSGLKKSMSLAQRDNTTFAKDFILYLNSKKIDMASLDEAQLEQAVKEWQKEKRPSLDLLILATIDDMKKVAIEKVRRSMEEEGKDEKEIEDNCKYLENWDNYQNLLDYYEEQGSHFFEITDFRKLRTYFRLYHLHEEDKIYFDPNFVPVPKNGIKMIVRFNEFKKYTKYDFIDVYKHFWDETKVIEEKENKMRADGTYGTPAAVIEQKIEVDTGEDDFDDIEFI